MRRNINPAMEIIKALAKLGEASFGEILKEANISRQALDIHLKRMLDKKLILSKQDPKDKRKWIYWLNKDAVILFLKELIAEKRREIAEIEGLINQIKEAGE